MDATGLMQSLKSKPAALVLSIVLHAVVLILLGINLSSNEPPKTSGNKQQIVKAFMVDAEAVDREIEKLKQSEADKKNAIEKEKQRLRRQVEKEKQRLANIKKEQQALKARKAEKKAAEKKAETARKKQLARKKAELKKQQDIARKKAESAKKAKAAAAAKAAAKKQAAKEKAELEEKKRAEEQRLAAIKKQQQDIEDEKRRQIEERELQQKLHEESLRVARHNDMLASLREQYVRLIEQKVERNWLRPVTVNLDYRCEVFVTQSVLGDVLQVKFGTCAGDQVFRNSIERAVRKSSPLPPPPNPEVFDREIRFVFKPDA